MVKDKRDMKKELNHLTNKKIGLQKSADSRQSVRKSDESTKILAIIPARGNSKGVPKKNIEPLLDKPLIYYSIDIAKKLSLIDKVIVSTDNDEIAKISKLCGADVIIRPPELATDTVPTEPALIHVLEVLEKENYKPDYVLLLQPTSPIRRMEDIENSLNMVLKGGLDSLLSVKYNKHFIWREMNGNFTSVNYNFLKRPRRQDREPEFLENGSIYITSYHILMKTKNRLGGKIGYYVMDEESSIEIDSEFDFWLAETILKKYYKRSK